MHDTQQGASGLSSSLPQSPETKESIISHNFRFSLIFNPILYKVNNLALNKVLTTLFLFAK
jgi:hypothetical protein